MAKYLGLIKMSQDEASRIVHHGVSSRRGFLEMLVRKSGGKLDHYRLTNVGDRDIICVVDMTDSTPVGDAVEATLQEGLTG